MGSLLYITNSAGHDIAFVVNMLSWHTNNPSAKHWTALERMFKYLRGTINFCLLYTRYPDVIEGYTDAN